jgi:hypothetical protein
MMRRRGSPLNHIPSLLFKMAANVITWPFFSVRVFVWNLQIQYLVQEYRASRTHPSQNLVTGWLNSRVTFLFWPCGWQGPAAGGWKMPPHCGPTPYITWGSAAASASCQSFLTRRVSSPTQASHLILSCSFLSRPSHEHRLFLLVAGSSACKS